MEKKTLNDAYKKRKAAQKKLKKTLFRWKADPEAAAQLFDEAALIFRNNGEAQLAFECYFASGECQNDIMPMAAGLAFEHAGTIAREMKDSAKALEAHKKAAHAFNVEFNHDRAIRNYTLASKAVKDSDPQLALGVLKEAMANVENYNKEHLANDMFRLLQDILMPNGMYQETMELLSEYSSVYARINQMHRVYTLGLSIVIVALHTGDVRRARGEFQAFCDKYPEFDFSEAGFCANDLVTAFETGDPDLLDSKKRSQPVGQCHSMIARCARDFSVERSAHQDQEEERDPYGGRSAIEVAMEASNKRRGQSPSEGEGSDGESQGEEEETVSDRPPPPRQQSHGRGDGANELADLT